MRVRVRVGVRGWGVGLGKGGGDALTVSKSDKSVARHSFVVLRGFGA